MDKQNCLNELNERLSRCFCDADECTKNFIAQAVENIELFCRKHHDYGPGNIAKFGAHGVMVRANDKLERLINIKHKPPQEQNPLNESLLDTWQDIANYGIIGHLCETGRWPNK